MTKEKWIILGIAFCLVSIVFKSRYLSLDAGVVTLSPDYGVHLLIGEHIKAGDLFPGLGKSEVGLHAVSKYLPVYHGLLGFHLLAHVLEILGMPVPGAYALLMDLSFLVIVIVGIFLIIDRAKEGWRWEYLFAMVLIFPVYFTYFTEAVDAAFFSQLFSHALIALTFYFYSRGRKALALLFFIYAAFSYPDFLIWFIPIALFVLDKRLWGWKIPLFLIWVILMWIPFSRSHLFGPLVAGAFPMIALCAFILLFSVDLWRQSKQLAILTGSFVLYSLVLILATSQNSNPSYYAAKISCFSYLLLPFLLLRLPILQNFRGKLFVLCGAYLLVAQGTYWSSYANAYLKGVSVFSNKDYILSQDIKRQLIELQVRGICKVQQSYIFPSAAMQKEPVQIWLHNASLMNSDIYSIALKHPGLHSAFDQGKVGASGQNLFSRFLLESAENWLSKLEQERLQGRLEPDLCLALPSEYASIFANSQNFETIFVGAQFVYFKPKKSEKREFHPSDGGH